MTNDEPQREPIVPPLLVKRLLYYDYNHAEPIVLRGSEGRTFNGQVAASGAPKPPLCVSFGGGPPVVGTITFWSRTPDTFDLVCVCESVLAHRCVFGCRSVWAVESPS